MQVLQAWDLAVAVPSLMRLARAVRVSAVVGATTRDALELLVFKLSDLKTVDLQSFLFLVRHHVTPWQPEPSRLD